MARVSSTSTSADGLDNNRNDSNRYYSDYGQNVHTRYSPSLVSWMTCSPDSTQTLVPVVANQHNLFFHPQEQAPVSDDLELQTCISPDKLLTGSNDGQYHYDNGAFQRGFGSYRLGSERLQRDTEERRLQNEYQPMHDSVSQYRILHEPCLGDFMAEPNVVPELGQQTLSSTNAPLQKKVQSEEPYANLIHEALKGAKGYTLALQELYRWFEENTDKPRKGTGWQNSIRHNLSLNESLEELVISF
ncbi:forkhead box protein J2 [Colletotrichum liriopes]|uniref:Forkhead box protein J2 n=1 Tax=Colletotrichum liriopes TaxID=708192 RepID=A0AA37H1A1_9PEZI|nr:forkhead box protein J2 [Colletotrichum liriopes]